MTRLGVAGLSLVLGVACGEATGVLDGGAGPPLYAVSVQVFSADLSERTTFVGFTDDLEGGMLLLDDAVEVPGGGNLWGVDGSGTYYVTSAESPVVTKWRVEDGAPVEVGRVGLAAEGVTRLFGEVMTFVDDSRGYVFDMLSGQAIALDLDAMEITGTVDLSELLDPEPAFSTFLWSRFFRRGDERVSFTFAADFVQDRISPVSRVFHFDAETGAIEVADAPCGGLQYGAELPSGDVVMTSGPVTAATHAIDEARAPAPCLVRLPAGARVPNDAPLDLNGIAGGPTGGIVPGAGSLAYLRVLDTDAFPPRPDQTSGELFAAPGWGTVALDLDDPTSVQPLDDPPVPGGIRWIGVGEDVYDTRTAPSFATTQLLRTTGADAPTTALTTPGVTFAIVRLR